MLSLAKKKLDKILINAKAGTPYPNSAFTISFEARINPKLAGIENRRESSKDLF